MTSLAGVVFAFYYNNLFPEQIFHISRSIELILGPIIGGIGTLVGPLVGALLITGLAEGMRELMLQLGIDVPGVKQVFYGVCLLLVVMFLPEGVWPPLARKLSLDARVLASTLEIVPRPARGARGELLGARGRDRRPDRAQRRRQDHHLQHDRRGLRAGRRRDRFSSRQNRRPAPGPGLRRRHRAHLPAGQALRRPLGARQRHRGGAAQGAQRGRGPHPRAFHPEKAQPGLEGAPARVLAHAARPQAAGGGARARHPAAGCCCSTR